MFQIWFNWVLCGTLEQLSVWKGMCLRSGTVRSHKMITKLYYRKLSGCKHDWDKCAAPKGAGHTETGVINEAALTSSKCWLDAVKAFVTHTTINPFLLVMRDEYYSSKEVQVPKTCLCIIKTKRRERKKKPKSFLELTAHFKTALVAIKSCVVLLWYFVCVFLCFLTHWMSYFVLFSF